MVVGLTGSVFPLSIHLCRYLGMHVQSFALGTESDDLNLVFWHWSDRRPSRVVVIDDEGRLLKNPSS